MFFEKKIFMCITVETKHKHKQKVSCRLTLLVNIHTPHLKTPPQFTYIEGVDK